MNKQTSLNALKIIYYRTEETVKERGRNIFLAVGLAWTCGYSLLCKGILGRDN